MKRVGRYLLLFLTIIGLDQYLKIWTLAQIIEHIEYTPVFPYGGISLFQLFGIEGCLHVVFNTGAIWGVWQGWTYPLLGIRLILLAILCYFLIQERGKGLIAIGYALIASGAIGNIIDVIRYGAVCDIIKIVFWGYHYPVFNIADAAIVAGIAILMVGSMIKKSTTLHGSTQSFNPS